MTERDLDLINYLFAEVLANDSNMKNGNPNISMEMST